MLYSLLEHRWRPRTDRDAFVEWDPRSFNALADHAANVAVDTGHDCDQIDLKATRKAQNEAARIRVCSDGALRRNGRAAARMAMIAYFPDGSHVVLRRADKILQGVSSVYVFEVVALEWSIQCFLKFCGLSVI